MDTMPGAHTVALPLLQSGVCAVSLTCTLGCLWSAVAMLRRTHNQFPGRWSVVHHEVAMLLTPQPIVTITFRPWYTQAVMLHAYTHAFPPPRVPFLAFTGTADHTAPPSMARMCGCAILCVSMAVCG